jgi:FixJ family two-component response regulator
MLARGIEAAGFDVAVFNSAEEFLASGKLEESACLVLDIDLPGMNGIELYKRLHQSDTGMPVIFISGHADEHKKSRTLTAPENIFFSKPFNIDSLLVAIQAIHRDPQITQITQISN